MSGSESELGRQALKTRQTREKIINAVIALIKEGGFSAASSTRIAERAGMTWGAAQHHFGSKEDILDAVLEVSHQAFGELMADPALRQGFAEARAQRFVDRMWQHYQSDIYHATLEILLATRGLEQRVVTLWLDQLARGHLITLRKIFHDFNLSDARMLEALVFVHCFLTGLTVERVFDKKTQDFAAHLQRIKRVFLSILTGF